MLQNATITAFVVSELLRENQQGAGLNLPLPPSRLGLKAWHRFAIFTFFSFKKF